jgi:hypothetical protein
MSEEWEKLDEAIKEVGREIGLRKNIYPRWVKSGRMTEVEAAQHLVAMINAYNFLKEARVAAKALSNLRTRNSLMGLKP